MEGGDKAKGFGLAGRKEVIKSGRSEHRVQTGLWGQKQSSASHLEGGKHKGHALYLCQVPDSKVVLSPALHCSHSEDRILE